MQKPPSGVTRIVERPGTPPILAITRCTIVVVSGPDNGRSAVLTRQTVRIGTSAENEIALTDPGVSAFHAELSLTEHGVLLRDRRSTNGTFVDGHRVEAVYLRDGSTIDLGQTQLCFRMTSDQLEVSLSTATNFGALLGHSAGMRAAFAVLESAAKSDLTVLIAGESGTGKEIAARALHEASTRREGPFVIFDCGAVTPTLVDSHLFGHARGAFTGAVEARAGSFEEAHGGTLVLDEIGELPIDIQPKLLRAVETKTIQRLGEDKRRIVDVRLIASTNRNLEEEVRVGRFRRDLWFRLSVIAVVLPPLRERKEEIPRLVAHFLAKLNRNQTQEVPNALMDLFMQHYWPGNVRELKNAVDRLCALPNMDPASYLQTAPPGPPLGRAGAGPPIPFEQPFHEAKRSCVEQFERDYLMHHLLACDRNISEVARVSGLSRQSCYRLMQKYGLEVPDERREP